VTNLSSVKSTKPVNSIELLIRVKRCMWCLPAGLILLLMGLMIQSALAAYADVQVHQAERIERRWVSGSTQFNKADYDRAQAHLNQGLSLNSDNADFHQMSGRLAGWVLADSFSSGTYDKAVAHFEASISARPYWPYAYSDFSGIIALKLSLKSHQKGNDDLELILNSYWDNALKYGENEPLVVQSLLNIGFGNWHVSGWKLKNKTIALFQASLESNSMMQREAINLARYYQFTQVLCQFYRLEGEVPRPMIRECNKYN